METPTVLRPVVPETCVAEPGTGGPRIFARCVHLLATLWQYVYWHRRFYAFGWRSYVGRCDMLTNPRAISIGRNVLIRKGARLEAIGPALDGPKLIIGDGTAIQFYFHCGAAGRVTIGRNVLMGGRVYITDHDHSFDEPQLSAAESPRLKVAPVEIGDGAFLGEGCVILKGVRIGKRAVVAANAVVTRDVPDFAVVAGVPARVVKSISVPTTARCEEISPERCGSESWIAHPQLQD